RRSRHTRFSRDWSSDVCSSDLVDHLAQHKLRILGHVGEVRPARTEGVHDPQGLEDLIQHESLLERKPGQVDLHFLRGPLREPGGDRKSTRLNSSHVKISYAVFC